MPQPPDAELIARVVATDDVRAFEQLVRRHQSTVRRFLRGLNVDAAIVDDVAQDAFLSAYRNIGSFRREAQFSTWLMSIAYNELRNAMRRQARFRRLRAALFRQPPPIPDEPNDRAGPALNIALRQLSQDERTVVVLNHGHDLSHAEIATITGLPLGTVKSHATRGKSKLRAALTEGVVSNGNR